MRSWLELIRFFMTQWLCLHGLSEAMVSRRILHAQAVMLDPEAVQWLLLLSPMGSNVLEQAANLLLPYPSIG